VNLSAIRDIERCIMRLRIATFNLENLDEDSTSETLASRILILLPQLQPIRTLSELTL
jgi:hypothetical protein